MAQFSTAQHWENIGVRHHHGICVPLGAIRTKTSGGLGEFLDIIPFASWLIDVGFDTIQILPINDSWFESSPYMCISGFALNPIYIALAHLPDIAIDSNYQQVLQLQNLPLGHYNYQAILHKKLTILFSYIQGHYTELTSHLGFQQFCYEHHTWLDAYAQFCAVYHPYQQPEATWKIIQFICFQQLKTAKTHCDAIGIKIFGDIPLLLSKDSIDIRQYPSLFSRTKTVGAPPDMYAPEGQYWGFPAYRWENHYKTDFAWWEKRLQFHATFYHLFRIDHCLGFFRFWAIPKGKKPTQGSFIPKEQHSWIPQGETILTKLIESSSMLPIGEDLGSGADCIRPSLHALGIPGLKILRWERAAKDCSFIDPTTFSPESVSMLSTHDASSMRQWWEEEKEYSQRMANDFTLPWSQPFTPDIAQMLLHICHTSGSLFHINLLQEYLFLFPELAWEDPQLDRINIPGVISPSNWTFAPKVLMEVIFQHTALKTCLQQLSSYYDL